MDKAEISGAMVIASGLLVGGLIAIFAPRPGVETPCLARGTSGTGEVTDETPAWGGGGPAAWLVAGATAETSPSAQPTSGKQEAARRGGGAAPAGERRLLGRGPAGARHGLGPVDLNSADAAEIETLDGVGPTLSLRIVKLRESKGGRFHSLDELLEVRGIGRATLERIGSCVTIGTTAPEVFQNNVFRKSISVHADSSSSQR